MHHPQVTTFNRPLLSLYTRIFMPIMRGLEVLPSLSIQHLPPYPSVESTRVGTPTPRRYRTNKDPLIADQHINNSSVKTCY